MRQLYSSKQVDNKHIDMFRNRVVNIVLVVTFVLFLLSFSQAIVKIRKINNEVENRTGQLEKLKKEEEELKKKYEEVTSDEYMEKQLRNQLNLSKENEVILVLPEDELLKKLVPQDEDEAQADTRANWEKWAEVFGIKI